MTQAPVRRLAPALLLTLCACSPSASDVCQELIEANVAQACEPPVVDATGQESVRFPLRGTGSHGWLYIFADEDAYREGLATSERAADWHVRNAQSRPYYIHNSRHRLSLMLVSSANSETRQRAAAVVNGL